MGFFRSPYPHDVAKVRNGDEPAMWFSGCRSIYGPNPDETFAQDELLSGRRQRDGPRKLKDGRLISLAKVAPAQHVREVDGPYAVGVQEVRMDLDSAAVRGAAVVPGVAALAPGAVALAWSGHHVVAMLCSSGIKKEPGGSSRLTSISHIFFTRLLSRVSGVFPTRVLSR